MYEVIIGLRFIRASKKNKFLSFISILSTLGIALGVATLIIVLSVMNGFQKEVRDKMLSVLSHIEVFSQSLDKDISKDIMEGIETEREYRGNFHVFVCYCCCYSRKENGGSFGAGNCARNGRKCK